MRKREIGEKIIQVKRMVLTRDFNKNSLYREEKLWCEVGVTWGWRCKLTEYIFDLAKGGI